MKFDTGYFIISKFIEYEITTVVVRKFRTTPCER